MEIQIDDDTKARIAKHGPAKLFGDFKERQELSGEELRRRFDEVWKKELGDAINEAEPSRTSKKSLEIQLTSRERQYFDDSQEHRQLMLEDRGLRLLAQLRVDNLKNHG